MSANAIRFGRIVTERRGALDLTQVKLGLRGGPSNSTFTAIEAGKWTPSAATYRKLDAALEWQPGSARRTYEGGEPAPLEVDAIPAADASSLTDDELLAELTYRVKRYAALNARRSPSGGKVVIPKTPRRQATSPKPPRAPRQ